MTHPTGVGGESCQVGKTLPINSHNAKSAVIIQEKLIDAPKTVIEVLRKINVFIFIVLVMLLIVIS